MGVKGLTSFIAQIDRSLAHQVDFPSKDPSSSTQDSASDPSSSSSSSSNPFLVIDGWAWLYNAYLDNFPKTAKGGQYLEFTQLIKQLVFAWRSVGLDFAFVFDGPAEPKKVPVITSRSDAQCQKNASTMRLSSFSRASSKQGLLPPLTYLTAITTLKELGVEIIFAETEADGIVAELSESRRGYAVSQDSDFFILCSKEKGCLGYVPLNTLEFVWRLPDHSTPQQITETNQETMNVPEDDGFAPVKSKGKSSRRNANQNNNNNFHNSSYAAPSTSMTNSSDRQEGNLTVSHNPPPIPSPSSSSTSDNQSQSSAQPTLSSFRFKSYLSSDLASHLELPPNLLPLLAALCGNDFTSNKHSQLLYSNLGKSASKIPFVAKTLREEWLKSQNPKAKKGNVSKSSSSSRLNSGANTPSLSYKASFGSKELPAGGLSSGPKSDSGRSAVSNATVTTSSPASSPSKKDQVGKLSNKLSSIALANLTELNNSNSASKDNPNSSYSKANSIISESDAQTVSNLTGSGFLGSDLDQSEELDPVKSLVKSVIERLLELNYGNLKAGRDSYISSGDKEDLIEGILQGFESYSFVSSQISFLTNPSFEFFNPEDRLGTETNHSGNNNKRGSEVLKSYNESYKKGRFDTFLIEALTSRHWITKPYLEDPDEISTQAGAGKKLREWIYAVLFDVWGMDWCRDETEIIEEDEEEDENENENDQDEIQFADELGENDTSLRRKKWIGGDGYKSGEDPDDVISVNDDTSGSEFSNSYQSDKAPIHSIGSKDEEDQSSSQIETEDLNPDQILPIRPSSVISNFYKEEDEEDDEKPIGKKSKRGNKDLPAPAVTEYIRRGTRLTPELVRIKSLTDLLKGGSSEDSGLSENAIHKILKSNFNPLPSSLGDLLAQYEAAQAVNPVEDVNASISTIKSDPFPSPIPSHPLSTRFDLFLVANHSNLKSLREKVPKNLWLFISSIRFMIIEAASRHLETSKKKNWKRKEIEVLLKVGICCFNLNQRIIKDQSFSIQQCLDQLVSEEKRRNLFNLNTVRQIHLNSTIQMILEINFYLCQSLLIDEELGSDPEKFIDGELLVLELCRMENKSNAEGISEPLLPKEGFEEKDEENVKVYLEVVLQGLEDVLGIDVEEERRLRKLEKKMAGKTQVQQSGTNNGNGKSGASGKKVNPFDLLGEE